MITAAAVMLLGVGLCWAIQTLAAARHSFDTGSGTSLRIK